MDQSAIRYLPPLTHGFGIEAEGMQAVWRDFVKTPSTFSVAMVDGGESKFEISPDLCNLSLGSSLVDSK